MNIGNSNLSFGSISVSLLNGEKKKAAPLMEKLENTPSVQIRRGPYDFIKDFVITSTPKNERAISSAFHLLNITHFITNLERTPEIVAKELKLD